MSSDGQDADYEDENEYKEALDYWGYLIREDKGPAPLFEQLLLGIAKFISRNVEPSWVHGLAPNKLAAFYRSVGGDYDALFLTTPHDSLSFIYRSLGCFHSLQPIEDPYAPPTVPCLLQAGFVRWQTIQLLLSPEEYVPLLQEAVRKYDIINPADGMVFLKILPKESFPDTADKDMIKWHDGVLEQLEKAADGFGTTSPSSPQPEDKSSRGKHTAEPTRPFYFAGVSSQNGYSSSSPYPLSPGDYFFRHTEPRSSPKQQQQQQQQQQRESRWASEAEPETTKHKHTSRTTYNIRPRRNSLPDGLADHFRHVSSTSNTRSRKSPLSEAAQSSQSQHRPHSHHHHKERYHAVGHSKARPPSPTSSTGSDTASTVSLSPEPSPKAKSRLSPATTKSSHKSSRTRTHASPTPPFGLSPSPSPAAPSESRAPPPIAPSPPEPPDVRRIQHHTIYNYPPHHGFSYVEPASQAQTSTPQQTQIRPRHRSVHQHVSARSTPQGGIGGGVRIGPVVDGRMVAGMPMGYMGVSAGLGMGMNASPRMEGVQYVNVGMGTSPGRRSGERRGW